MKVLLSTACFPNLEYMAVIAAKREVWIEACETYARQSYRNRYYIAGPESRQMLVVPVIRPQGNHTPIQHVMPDHRVPWQRNHLRAIETSYNRSAFFLYYRDVTEVLFETGTRSLLEWNLWVLKHLLEMLRIDAVIHCTELFEETPAHFIDLRQRIHPKKDTSLLKSGIEPYFQPFSPKYGFIPNLSVLDLLYNQGPRAGEYLERLSAKISFQEEG